MLMSFHVMLMQWSRCHGVDAVVSKVQGVSDSRLLAKAFTISAGFSCSAEGEPQGKADNLSPSQLASDTADNSSLREAVHS